MTVQLPLFQDSGVMPTGKCHVSYSEWFAWKTCGWKHKLLYIDKVARDPDNLFSIFGGVLHEAMESWVLEKDRSQSSMNRLAEEAVDQFWERVTKLEDPAINEDLVETCADELGSLLRGVPKFLDDTFPGYQVVGVEIPLFESVRTGRWFKGFVDFVFLVDGVWVVGDWKTSINGWDDKKRTDPMKIAQLALYKHFLVTKLGLPSDKVKVGWVVMNRQTSTMEWIPVEDIDSHIDSSLKDVKSMIASVEKRWYTKNRYACTYCQFAHTPECP